MRHHPNTCFSPLEEEEVDVVVALGQEVSQYARGITTPDLIRRQTEVDALHKVPELGHCVLTEAPGK